MALAGWVFAGSAYGGCFVETGTLAFGPYDVSDPQPRDSAMVISVSCQEAQARDLSVAIGPSATSGQIHSRQMVGGTDASRLSYNLFADAGRTQVWGDGTISPPVTVRGVSRETPRQLTVFARIPPGQNPSVGNYTDSITVTVDVLR